MNNILLDTVVANLPISAYVNRGGYVAYYNCCTDYRHAGGLN